MHSAWIQGVNVMHHRNVKYCFNTLFYKNTVNLTAETDILIWRNIHWMYSKRIVGLNDQCPYNYTSQFVQGIFKIHDSIKCGSKHGAILERNTSKYAHVQFGLNWQCVIPTVKFSGGSVMFWGCFNYRGHWLESMVSWLSPSSRQFWLTIWLHLPQDWDFVGELSRKTITQIIYQNPHRNGNVTTKSMFCSGYLRYQTSIQL